jgi:nucleotide-binding universal stress UspA family protein
MTSPFARPAVAVDVGGSDALGVVRWAAREASRRGATLRLVRVLPRRSAPGRAKHDLDEAAQVAAASVPGTGIERVVAVGSATGRLAAESRRAELLVVGARRRVGLWSVVSAGPRGLALGRTARCPVAVVPEAGSTPDPTLPVVVGVDGSPGDEAAIRFAFDAAAGRNAVLLAVHTWAGYIVDDSPADLADWDRVAAEERAVLDERLARSAAQHPGVTVHRICRATSATRLLVELSHRAQLVVIGSHGHGRLAGHLVDAAGHGLARAAACPWVVARTVATPIAIATFGGCHG